MRYFNNGLLAIAALFACGIYCVSSTPIGEEQKLIGGSKCTWGPSYWCDNLSTAKSCSATRHCVQTVWEKHNVPEDNDSICKICKDMVTQARDQLRSNETEEEIEEVLEGSCKLMVIKPIVKECCKMVDDFMPDLIEALSSQMNPDQVCSVAGLCNSARIDEMLKNGYQAALEGTVEDEDEEHEKQPTRSVAIPKNLSCGNCNSLTALMQRKFASTKRDDMLENVLHICGQMSSFSDACANIAITYFNDIYDHLNQHLTANGMCHLSGVCAAKYHQHEGDAKEPEPLKNIEADPDIPCALCEQLVKHLRDVLVANTTETEFKQVLEGFCKQTKSNFKAECLSIVDEYYHLIYQSLVNNLDANGMCFLIGVCPKQNQLDESFDIMPLLPAIAPAEVHVSIKKLGANEPKFTQDEIIGMQIPIDHLMGAANPGLLVNGGETCTICEYVLHFIQESLATPATSDEIKHSVENICKLLPNGVVGQCDNFVEMYGDAVIALLIQGLNPRTVCPKMQLCPHNIEKEEDIEVFHPIPIEHDEQDKPTCPLCLFAVEQAQQKIRDNKSKDNIKQVLDGLCAHLPAKLKSECVDFVETYSNELIDMLITDFKPQEICVQLKLCPKTNDFLDDLGISLEDDNSSEEKDGSNENEISKEELPIVFGFDTDYTITPNCILCKEVVKEVEKKMGKNPTKAIIKEKLEHSCDKLKKNLQTKCHHFVDKHGDQIADLLLKEMAPELICTELGMCVGSELDDLEIDEALKYDVIVLPKQQQQNSQLDRLQSASVESTEPPTCVLCEFVMTKLETELKDKTNQDEIKHAVRTICERMPKTVRKPCDQFIDGYASAVINLITKVPPKEICQKIQLCFSVAVTDEVIDCGVCHGATQTLIPYLREHQQELSTQDMTSVACENVPAKYYNICSEMISIYGISIKNLAGKPDEPNVCAAIGKCFNSEKSSLAFAKLTA